MAIIIVFTNSGCQKMVTVKSLTDKLLASQVFDTEATANSAIAGIYESSETELANSSSIDVYTGLSSDELNYYSNSTNDYQNNSLLPTDYSPWGDYYRIIYQCNAAIEGLKSSSLSASIKT